MTSAWWYDEWKQVGTDYASAAEVEAYDARMAKLRDVAAEAEAIATWLPAGPDAVIWEIGTGTGECALRLAAGRGRVFAADISAAMLDFARGKAARRGVTNVEFVEGGFLSGFRPDEPVAGAFSQMALHHLPDFWKLQALQRIAASLKPGGRFYLRDVVFPGDAADMTAHLDTIVEAVRARAGDAMADNTIRHFRDEYSTYDWVLEGMFERAGLRIVHREVTGFIDVYVGER